jgi:hypothetical protein
MDPADPVDLEIPWNQQYLVLQMVPVDLEVPVNQ